MPDFDTFHFLRPEWLFTLIPLLVLLLSIRHLHRQQSGWQSVLASHLYQHLITSKGNKKQRPPLILLGLGWLLAVIALAGPAWEQLPQPVYQLNTGKVVVMDMSMSMRATDVKPDRLTRAKFKAIDLINAIGEGETGLVAYAGDAFTISPLSSDAQNLTTLVPSLSPEIMPVAGSEPYLGLLSAVELLNNAGFQQGEIFWLTDGIENSQLQEVRELIEQSNYRLSVLAVGTEDGAPIQLTDGELMKDSRGAIVLPKLSPSNLKSIVAAGDGRYAPLQADDSDIDYLVSQQLVDRETQEDEESESKFGDEWKETGPYLLLLLLPIAAYSFRRGLISCFALFMLLPGYTPEASANWWDDLWQTGDQQGQQAFSQGQFDQAAENFDDPLWKGSAHYKNGDYQAALDAYSQSDSTQALYNQGNALAQLGELEQAINAYEQVLAQEPEHADAKANKALLEQLKQQQEQEQQNQQQDQQDQQNQQDQESQQDQQNQQQDQQNQQDQQGQQDDSRSGQQNEPQNEPEQPESESEEQQQEQDQQQSEEEQQNQQQPQPAEAQEKELTEEEKEQMQRMQNLLRKVPDDPAFLLKRKMMLEHQQRRRERMPNQLQRKW